MVGLPLEVVVMLCMPMLLFFMFLPTVIELKKPKDAGPRQILPQLPLVIASKQMEVSHLPDMENYEVRAPKQMIASIIGALPSIEA